ncbi:hypothetical protein [Streptomyces syringium]|uniref:hypothetical protein n=1 Tax=Streptomyces syringium TaxID=76729 RepID=UPI003AAC8968
MKKKLQSFAFYVMPVLSPALTILFTLLAAGASGFVWLACVGLALLSAMVAPYIAERLRKRNLRIEGIKSEAAISAVVDHMGTLVGADPSDVPKILGQIHDRLITHLANSASSKARSAFYSLGGGRLRREVVHGSANPPEYFDSKNEQALLNVLNQGEIVYIPDNRHTNGTLKFSLGDDYQAAVVAPVRAGNQPQGVLIIDAPKAGALSQEKVRKSYVLVLTGMLGTSHALGRRATES